MPIRSYHSLCSISLVVLTMADLRFASIHIIESATLTKTHLKEIYSVAMDLQSMMIYIR